MLDILSLLAFTLGLVCVGLALSSTLRIKLAVWGTPSVNDPGFPLWLVAVAWLLLLPVLHIWGSTFLSICLIARYLQTR